MSQNLIIIQSWVELIDFIFTASYFEEFINTYFDSKFTTELREILYDYTIETVWDLLDEFEGDQDSLNHLRGACDRLLTENPENAALMLFRAFSRLLIINYNKSDALSDLRKGWKIFIEKEGWSRKESAVKFQKYYDKKGFVLAKQGICVAQHKYQLKGSLNQDYNLSDIYL